MALTQDQIKELKDQLRQQVDHLPAQQKTAALQQIEAMSPQALETLVEEQRQKNPRSEKTIYRMLVQGEVPSVKIDEDDWALAVLEINPASRGHMLIIPKTAIKEDEEMPKGVIKFANTLAKRITKKLSAKNTEVLIEDKFGEKVVSIIPSYTTIITTNSPRTKATQEELETLAKELKVVKRIPVVRIKKPKAKPSQVLHLQRRIP